MTPPNPPPDTHQTVAETDTHPPDTLIIDHVDNPLVSLPADPVSSIESTPIRTDPKPLRYGDPLHASTRCGAKLRRRKGTCQNWGMENGRCRMHGGATPKGIESSSWKHGRYSKYMPSGMRAKYEESMSDPELLALNDEIALVRSRLQELLEKLDDSPDAGGTWNQLRTATIAFELAQRDASGMVAGDARDAAMAEVSQLWKDLKSTIEGGAAEWAAWREIIQLTGQVKRLAESEQKRRVAGEFILGMADVMSLFDYVVNLINDIVSDPEEKRRIADGLARLGSDLDGGRVNK